MIDFKGGRLPNDPTKPRLKLANVLEGAAPAYPENRDWLSRVTNFPMYLNDRIGDCTCAAVGHIIEVATTYGSGTTQTISDNDVLVAYEAVSGYDPRTGANDNGAVMQDVLNYWRKTGVGGHKIVAFAEVDVRNEDELRQALNLFGFLYIGINFPDSAMTQFDNGQPWDVVPGARNEGGHAIHGGYYDVSDNMWKVTTWGAVQGMTQAFWDEYVEEAWVVVTDEWINTNGTNPDGIDMASLGEAFTQITGEANPFPSPTPAPTPEPVPTPAPVPEPTPAPVDDVDAKFIEAAERWLARVPFFYRKFQFELRQWLEAKK